MAGCAVHALGLRSHSCATTIEECSSVSKLLLHALYSVSRTLSVADARSMFPSLEARAVLAQDSKAAGRKRKGLEALPLRLELSTTNQRATWPSSGRQAAHHKYEWQARRSWPKISLANATRRCARSSDLIFGKPTDDWTASQLHNFTIDCSRLGPSQRSDCGWVLGRRHRNVDTRGAENGDTADRKVM